MKNTYTNAQLTPRRGAIFVGAVSFLLYLTTLAPSIGLVDSGELATVPFVLGIAHPTGYPVFTLLAHLFTWIPVPGEPVVRLNMMSALLTAGAAVLCFFVMLILLRKDEGEPARVGPAILSSLMLAFSQTFWDQSAHIEVYALHLFLVGAAMIPFLLVTTGGERYGGQLRLWLFFSYLLGLSFANHLSTVLLAPAFLYLYFSSRGFTRKSFALIGILALPFILGLSSYLYLPIRGAEHPLLNWGEPTTLEKMFWHISGKQYRVWMFSSSDVIAKQFSHFANAVPHEFFYIPLFLAVLGLCRLFRTDRRKGWFVLLLFLTCLIYTVNYDINEIDPYFLTAYIAIALASGAGILELLDLGKGKMYRKIVFLFLAIAVAGEAWTNRSETNERSNYLCEDYTRNVFSALEPRAIILSYQWDYFVAGSYYLQFVLHERPDVTVIDKELLRRSWYFDQLRTNAPEVYARSRKEIERFLPELYRFEHGLPYDGNLIEARYNELINSFIDKNFADRPVYLTPELEPQFGPSYRRVPEGLAYHLYRDTLYHPLPALQFTYRKYDRDDMWSIQLHNLYGQMLTQRAILEWRSGHRDEARRYVAMCDRIVPAFGASRILQALEKPH